MKKIIIPAALILLISLSFYALRTPVSPAEDREKPAEQAGEQASLPVSPELLRDRVLLPAVSFHPGTAGSSLGCAQAAAAVASFAAEYQLRLVDEAQLKHGLEDACALLSGGETEWFRENLPGLIGMIDSAFSDYSAVSGLFEDAGADAIMKSALAAEESSEDWAKLRAALMQLEANTVS